MHARVLYTLLWLGIILKLVLLARLFQLRLIRRYPTLAACIGFSLLRIGITTYLRRIGNTAAFGWFYLYTQPVLWVLYFLLLLEFYSLALEDFRGVRRLGRMVLFSALGGAAAICGLLIALDGQPGSFGYPLLSYLVLQDRSIFFCLSIVTALLLVFIWHYRLPMRRNLSVLFASFGGYFILSSAVSALFRYLGSSFTATRNLLNSICYLLALSLAGLLLSREGEAVSWKVRLPGDTNDLDLALISQLRGFNRVLAKVLRA